MTRQKSDAEFSSVDTERVNNTDWVTNSAEGHNLQSVIDNAPSGGTVRLPIPNGFTYYDIDSPITIDKPLTLSGEAFNAGELALQQMAGVIVRQNTAAEDIFNITVEEDAVNIENIGATWESSIRQSNTGHGFNCDPPDDADANAKVRGMVGSNWYNVAVRGVDPDHYGYRFVNPHLCAFHKPRSYYGGGMYFINDHDSINFGNCEIYGFYHRIQGTGSAHGIFHHGKKSRMNFNTFVRPQVNRASGLNASQLHIDFQEDAGGSVSSNNYLAADMEAADGSSGGINIANGSTISAQADLSSYLQGDPLALKLDTTKVQRNRVESQTFQGDFYKLSNQAGNFVNAFYSNNDEIFFENPNAASTTRIDMRSGGTIDLRAAGNLIATLLSSTETADGMTADPESSSEDAWITVDIGGTNYQIPLYQA